MKKNIHFVFDEHWHEQEQELKQILHETKDPELHKNVFVLESIMRAAALGFTDKIKMPSNRLMGEEISKNKYYEDVVNVPIEFEKVPVPTAGKLEKTGSRYTQKIVMDKEPERIDFSKSHKGKRNLIIDRITKRVLASVSLDKEYILNEPRLEVNDLKVLDKVKSKKVKNMEKGWDLIQKYSKKYRLPPGRDTSIKYYVVNDVFGLGKLEPFLHDNEVKNIKCNGADQELEVTIDDKELKTNVKFNDMDLRSFVEGMADKLNKKLNKKNPEVRGELRGFMFKLMLINDQPSFNVKRI